MNALMKNAALNQARPRGGLPLVSDAWATMTGSCTPAAYLSASSIAR